MTTLLEFPAFFADNNSDSRIWSKCCEKWLLSSPPTHTLRHSLVKSQRRGKGSHETVIQIWLVTVPVNLNVHSRALNVLSWTDVSRGTVNGAEGEMSSSFMVWSLGDDVGRPGIKDKKGGQQATMEVNIITILYICIYVKDCQKIKRKLWETKKRVDRRTGLHVNRASLKGRH